MYPRHMRKAQSMIEIVLIGAALVAAVLIMQVYVFRGYSGRLRQMADTGFGEQYNPVSGFEESSSIQEGTVKYEVRYLRGNEMGMSGVAGDKLYPRSVQYIGENGDEPMVSTMVTETGVDYKKE